ncbi:sulfotransferase [Salinibacter ruber]|uniref:sulfotransferase n=1 Tax=Salinibacter ruber TaxID=146919 RepID=UPI003C6DBE5A
MEGPIFVVGCDRSGTSLLTVMLDQSPTLKMIFEAGFLPRLVEHTSVYGDFSEPRQRWYFVRDLGSC